MDKEKDWKKEAKLSWDAYVEISKEGRKLERKNKKLKRRLEKYHNGIKGINKIIWRVSE